MVLGELEWNSVTVQPVIPPAASADSLPWTLNGEEHSRNPASETSEDPPPPLGSSSLEELLLAAYRRKRNSSQGVAGKCCSQGCTKNDIGRLC